MNPYLRLDSSLKTPNEDLIWGIDGQPRKERPLPQWSKCGRQGSNRKIGEGKPSLWCYNGEEQVVQLLRRCRHLPQKKNGVL